MTPSAHTIHRQTVELQVADARDAQRVRQRADLLCRHELAPLLERVLGSVAAGGDVIEIDRLVVDLAISSAGRFDAEFLPGVEAALRRALRRIRDAAAGELRPGSERMSSTAVANSFDRAASGSIQPAGFPAAGQDADAIVTADRRPSRPTVRAISSAAARGELLIYFLDTGRLPWWAAPDMASQTDALLSSYLQNEAADPSARVRTLVDREHRRARLARQFGRAALCDLVSRSTSLPLATLRATIEKALSGLPAACRPPAIPRFWEMLLNDLFRTAMPVSRTRFERLVDRAAGAAAGLPDTADTALNAAASESPVDPLTDGADLKVQPSADPSAPPIPGEAPPGRRMDAAARTPGGPAGPPSAAHALPGDATAGVAEGTVPCRDMPADQHNGAEADRSPDRPFDGPAVTAILDHATPVYNAGLVLVWPFLGRFFGSLGLTTDRGFVDTAAAERGVHLLHHLTDGSACAAEPRLLLGKILCGLPIDLPVVRELTLEPGEQRACRELLQAIIGHWQALGNTSVAGLQRSFLQRFGLLSPVETGFHLHVDRAAYDMLLDRLPWGISIVQLSWMKQPLTVEW